MTHIRNAPRRPRGHIPGNFIREVTLAQSVPDASLTAVASAVARLNTTQAVPAVAQTASLTTQVQVTRSLSSVQAVPAVAQVASASAISGGPVTLESDWVARSTAPGVFLAQNFNTDAAVTNNIWTEANRIRRDKLLKRSGSGAVRFDKPASDGASSGQIRLRFDGVNSTSGSSSVTRGNGTETWYQCTVYTPEGILRWKPAHTAGSGDGGMKYMWVSGGGSSSNTVSEIVVTNLAYSGFPVPYYQDGSSFADFYQYNVSTPNTGGGGNVRMTPAINDGTPATPTTDKQYKQRYGMLYADNTPGGGLSWTPNPGDTYAAGYPDPDVRLSGLPPLSRNGWTTMMLRVKIGTLGTASSEVDFWAGPPGETPVKIIGATNVILGNVPHGAFWHAAYDTERTPNSAGVPDTFTLATEFIASSQPIPWPAVKSRPAYVEAMPALTWTRILGTSYQAALAGDSATDKRGITAYCGAYATHSGIGAAASGGHSDKSGNEHVYCDLTAENPVMAVLRARSNPPAVDTAYAADGRPVARHTAWSIQYISSLNRVVLPGAFSIYQNANGLTNFDAFDMATNDWVAAGTYAATPDQDNVAHWVVKDKWENLYYQSTANGNLYKWTKATNAWSNLGSRSAYTYETAAVYDPVRNRIVRLGSNPARFDLNSSGAETSITFTGATAGAASNVSAVWCPDRNTILTKPWSGTTVYEIDPVTFNVTVLAVAGTPTAPDPEAAYGHLYGRWNYIEALGLIVMIPSYSSDLWVFKTRQ